LLPVEHALPVPEEPRRISLTPSTALIRSHESASNCDAHRNDSDSYKFHISQAGSTKAPGLSSGESCHDYGTHVRKRLQASEELQFALKIGL